MKPYHDSHFALLHDSGFSKFIEFLTPKYDFRSPHVIHARLQNYLLLIEELFRGILSGSQNYFKISAPKCRFFHLFEVNLL